MRTPLLASIALLAVGLTVTPADVVTTITGCLQRDKGTLYSVQEGGAPMHPCAKGDRAISFNQTGPQGPAGPQGAAAPAPLRFQVVGITTQRFDGTGGWAAMSGACNAQYPGARMAFSDEYRTTISAPAITEGAWIQSRPSIVDRTVAAWDSVGNQVSTDSYDCVGWTRHDAILAATLTPSGAILGEGCQTIRPAACSAPMP